MSQISLKSISGITSITTPAGVDNRFSLYNFDSTERLVLDHSGNLNISGISSATNFKTGSSNLHSTGIEVSNINASGIVTANSFSGDGSSLSGLASREVYGFTGIGKSLSLTTTNSGADNIDGATYAAFEESFIGPSGLSFSINTSGNLIMTV